MQTTDYRNAGFHVEIWKCQKTNEKARAKLNVKNKIAEIWVNTCFVSQPEQRVWKLIVQPFLHFKFEKKWKTFKTNATWQKVVRVDHF